MKIASTTLTGNSAGIIADALRSAVEWVDICLVIDTGVTDDTLAIAQNIAGANRRILQVRAGLALEAERLVDVEGDDLAA